MSNVIVTRTLLDHSLTRQHMGSPLGAPTPTEQLGALLLLQGLCLRVPVCRDVVCSRLRTILDFILKPDDDISAAALNLLAALFVWDYTTLTVRWRVSVSDMPVLLSPRRICSLVDSLEGPRPNYLCQVNFLSARFSSTAGSMS